MRKGLLSPTEDGRQGNGKEIGRGNKGFFLNVMLTGVALNLGCVAAALSGLEGGNFLAAMVLLGVGWNFMFIGGTTLLTETYRPEEKAKAQGMNDFAVFGVQAVTSLSSGLLISRQGWEAINHFALPAVLLTALLTAAYGLRQRKRSAAA